MYVEEISDIFVISYFFFPFYLGSQDLNLYQIKFPSPPLKKPHLKCLDNLSNYMYKQNQSGKK